MDIRIPPPANVLDRGATVKVTVQSVIAAARPPQPVMPCVAHPRLAASAAPAAECSCPGTASARLHTIQTIWPPLQSTNRSLLASLHAAGWPSPCPCMHGAAAEGGHLAAACVTGGAAAPEARPGCPARLRQHGPPGCTAALHSQPGALRSAEQLLDGASQGSGE